MRYRDATRMGKIYLMPSGVDAAGRGLGRTREPNADDPELDA